MFCLVTGLRQDDTRIRDLSQHLELHDARRSAGSAVPMQQRNIKEVISDATLD